MTVDRVTLLTAAVLLLGLALVYMPLLDQQMNPADTRLLHDLSPESGFDLRTVSVELGRTQGGAWTPLENLSLRLDAHLFGTASVTPFLLMNLGLHLLNAVLLLALLTRLRIGPNAAALVALAFALHPLQVESIATLAGRGELLGALCVILGLLLHVSKRPGILLCFVAGFAASPTAVLLGAFAILVDLGPRGIVPRQNYWTTRLPLLVAGILGIVLLATISRGYDRIFAASLPFALEIHQLASALLLSFADLAGAYTLAAMHTSPPVLSPWIPAVVLPLLIAAIIAGVARRPLARSGAICLLLILVAGAMRGRLGEQYRADTWLYLGVIALVWMCVGAIRTPNRVFRIAAAAILVNWAVLAHEQLAHWHDGDAIVDRTFTVEPSNWWARTMRADRFNAAGDPASAQAEALVAVTTQPNSAAAVVALADSRRGLGDDESALRLYERSLITHWGDRFGSRDLGLLLLDIGYPAEARILLERAGCDAGLALAFARAGDVDRAKEHRDASVADPPPTLEEKLALAWLLATAPEPELRDPQRALDLVLRIPGTESRARRLDIEAAARAVLGQSAAAFRLAQDAARHAEEQNRPRYAEEIRDRGLLYLQQEVWQEPRDSVPAANAQVDEQSDEKDDGRSDPRDR